MFRLPFPGYKHPKSTSKKAGYSSVGDVGDDDDEDEKVSTMCNLLLLCVFFASSTPHTVTP